MPRYRIILNSLYPKKGEVWQVITGLTGDLDAAKQKARDIWKKRFVGKAKRLLILEFPEHQKDKNDYTIVFQHEKN